MLQAEGKVGIWQEQDDSEPQASVVVDLEAAVRQRCWQCYHSCTCYWQYELEEQQTLEDSGGEKGEGQGTVAIEEAEEAHQCNNGG